MNIVPLQNLLDFSGKTAIVTGGAMGIGFGIATRLAEAGANVMIADLREEDAKKAVEQLVEKGWKASFVKTDVSQEDQVVAMVDATVAMYGGVDILVNNAGIFPSVPMMQMSLEDFAKVIRVNLNGVFLCTQKVAAKMIEQGRGGRMVNISSIDALHPSSVGLAHYDASKHGVWGFTKNVALELAPHKIWVNAVAPGGIATPGVAAMSGGSGAAAGVDMEQVMKSFLAKIPMGRMGDPDDIAKVVLFLASDMASYMTGEQVVVDGGYLLS